MNARIPSIDVSPEACAARAKRIEGYTVARRVRESELELARDIYRRHGIRDDAELLQALQNIAANCADSAWQERVMEVILDLDADMNTPEPAQTKAEYANPFEHYRRPSTKASKFAYCVAAAFLFAAVVIGAMR